MLVAIDRFSKLSSVKLTKSTNGKTTVKFLQFYIDKHRILDSIFSDQFFGFKGKTLNIFCTENKIEQKFWPVGEYRGCGLVERTIQAIKRRLGVLLLEENKRPIKLCLSTIIRDLRRNKQKTIQVSPFQVQFERLPETDFKIIRDKFIKKSDYLEKQHLEQSTLTASELRRRICQSGEKRVLSRDTSSIYKQQLSTARAPQRANVPKDLLEAKARWNKERRDAAKNEIRRTVNAAG